MISLAKLASSWFNGLTSWFKSTQNPINHQNIIGYQLIGFKFFYFLSRNLGRNQPCPTFSSLQIRALQRTTMESESVCTVEWILFCCFLTNSYFELVEQAFLLVRPPKLMLWVAINCCTDTKWKLCFRLKQKMSYSV